MRILLVEDDHLLAEGMVTALTRMNYRVEHCTLGSQAIQAVNHSSFELMILDLGLPDGSALHVIKTLRGNQHAIPILVLTAWDLLDTKIEALNAGADDYVLKPCDVRELEARMRVIVRRHQHRRVDQLQCGELLLDLSTHDCTFQGHKVALTNREFLIVKDFMLHQDKIMTRQHLDELSSGWTSESEGNSIEVHVHNIRKKISTNIIKTVRGVGYIMASNYEN